MNLKTQLTENYKKEIEVLKGIFGESIEKAGGKGHRFFHQLRVAQLCGELAEKYGLSEDEKNVLILAALYHDIGKATRIKEDGTLDGSQKADEKQGDHTNREHVFALLNKYLGELHDTNTLGRVADAISDRGSELFQMISDADNLDEVGLVNVWKMFTFGGAFNVDIEETIDYYFDEDRPRLLQKSEDVLFFDHSKELAKRRIQKVDDMLNNLLEEAQGVDAK